MKKTITPFFTCYWRVAWLMLFGCFLGLGAAQGQFIAFNDHASTANTAANATRYDLFGIGYPSSGLLKDINGGTNLPVTVTLTRNGTVYSSPSAGNPNPGTPLYNTFNGYVDFAAAGDSDAAVQVTGSSTVIYTFTGLNPNKVYSFKGGAVRGGSGGDYPLRWTLFELDGAQQFTSAHTSGSLTSGLAANQVAINTGINLNGDMVDWENIVPGAGGTFSVVSTQYTNAIPGGLTANGQYCYGLTGFRLQELGSITFTNPPVLLTATNSGGNAVFVTYSLAVQPASATNIANYSLTNLAGKVSVTGAAFGGGSNQIVLTTANQTPYAAHWLNVHGVTDALTGTNAIAANSRVIFTNIPFNAPALVSATNSGNNKVLVGFSIPVQAASATNLANYALTNLAGNVPIISAAFGSNSQNLVLTTASQVPYAAHWLNVHGVTDALTGTNAVPPASQAVYTNQPFLTGYIQRQLYFNLSSGQAVADLTNSANYPNNPDQVDYLTAMGWPVPNIADSYGGRLAGILVAPVDGTYYFSVESDDNSQLFLSTDESPVNRLMVSFEPSWGASFDQNSSTAIAMKAGQHYFIEGLMKEGGGGDYLYVGWKTPTNGNWQIIPGAFLGNYFTATNATVSMVQQPTNTSVMVGQSASFSALATGYSPITTYISYQWQSNGFDIPGAVSSNLITGPVGTTNQGVQYRVLAQVPGAAVFSSVATLTVTPDVTRPVVMQAQNFGTTNVQLLFSKQLEVASATAITNYVFTNGLAVLSAVLDPTASVVTLTTAPLAYGSNYSLVINNVRDRAATPNTILTNTTVNLLASPFALKDVGNPPLASVQQVLTNGLTISASGSDIGGVSDQFGFSYQLFTGNFDVTVRLASLSDPNPFAKAGLMARETMDPASRFVFAFGTPAMNGEAFMTRTAAGGTTTTSGSFPANYPNGWLRLQRFGSTFTGYGSYDGLVWTQLGSVSLALTNQVLLGLAVTSDQPTQYAQAKFLNFATTTNAVTGLVTNPHDILGPTSRKSMIAFTEIMYKPAPRTDGRNLEFVEIYNSNPWFQDISGYQIAGGSVSYTFPAGTVLQGGAFLVVAAVPGDITAVYGITNVMGPYGGSLKKTGIIELHSEVGALQLTVPYSNLYPWPVGTEGTGHSLVLAYPTYGEEDPRAWDLSDVVGGSPGQGEAYRPSPLRSVSINELLPHSENAGVPQFVELYNHSNLSNDISGVILTDDPTTNKFVAPPGTVIPPRGFVSFTAAQLGFALAGKGGTVFLFNPDSSRVLDAVQYEPQADGVSVGRWPDGANAFYQFNSRTPGTNNSSVLIGDVVINELMYNPISGNDADQYVELYNKGTNTINLGGWQFSAGLSYTFPSNAVMSPGAYLVVAFDRTNLWSKYTNLNSGNTVGDVAGRLSHNGERLALAKPQSLYGTNTIYVVQDEVSYGTGGRWGAWSSAGGSSLELRDAHANHRLAANWGDSDESQKSVWTNFETTGVLDNGANYDATIDYAQIGLLDSGECLVDNIEVNANGTNYVSNPTFEGGLANWNPQGDMYRSSLENSGYNSTRSLHIRCSDRLWTGDNSCEVFLWPNALGQGQTATLRYKARWLRGWPEVNFRLNGNWLELVGILPVPKNLGTPGLPNSIAVNNAGPAISEVTHYPPIPAAGQSVVVSARVHDPDGLQALVLNYRVDPATSYTSVSMKDDGTGGDSIAADGTYSVTLPGFAAGTLVAFYISALDKLAVPARFPALVNDNAPVREGIVVFGDANPGGSFGAYHLWVTRTNATRWSNLSDLSNELLDSTMVNGNRVIYNMTARFAGSPYHQGFDSPYGNLCHYKWVFNDDDKFLGATSFNKIHQPGNGAGDDGSLQREQYSHTLMRALGVPWLNRRYVAVFVNGNRRGLLMEDSQCPDSDLVKEYFPNDTTGYLYKMQPWFEFGPAPSGIAINFNNNSWVNLNQYTTTGNVKKKARYRYNWEIRRTADSADNFTNVFSLIDAANTAGSPNFVASVNGLADMENWMRVFAANHAAGNWDSFGSSNGQNLYSYFGAGGTRCSLMMWDFNIVIGNSSSWAPGENLLTVDGGDGPLVNIFNTPEFARMYWRALAELVAGPLDLANSGALLAAKYNAFVANGLNPENPNAAMTAWISQAHDSINQQRAGVDGTFGVSANVSVANNLATVTGTAPLVAKHVLINGSLYPLTWTSLTGWSIQVPLKPGTNQFSVTAVDRFGNPVPGGTGSAQAVFKGTPVPPVGQVVISEIMASPAVANAAFVELYNRSTTNSFDLSGWQFKGLGYVFPAGSSIAPNSFLVLANNRAAFAAAYGGTLPVFDVFAGTLQPLGEHLTLVQPDANGLLITGTNVAEVAFATALPWPTNTVGTGNSLQLVDARQDNWRVLNWRSTPATPGAANTVAATLTPSFPPVWINELQTDNRTGITNKAGQRTAWLELYNPTTNTAVLSGLYLSPNYTNLTAWAFPAGAVLSPGQFKLVFVDGQTNLSSLTELHTSFTLPPGSGSVAISRLDGGVARALDFVDYTGLPINYSYGSEPDGQSFARQFFATATAGTTNSTASPPGSFVAYTLAGAVYSQTFDSLPNPGATSVNTANPVTINGVTYSLSNPFDFAGQPLASGGQGGAGINALTGWYGAADPVASVGTRLGATFGDQTTGGNLSFGLPNEGERAMGLLATSSTGFTAFGLKLVNETGVTLNYVTLDYVGEVWRQSDKPKTLVFYYWLDPGATNGFTTNATQYVPALNVAIPTLSSAVGGVAVNGNLPANQQKVGVVNQPIVAWEPGTALWLSWQMPDPAGKAQGLAIDNLNFYASVQPVPPGPALTLQTQPGSGFILSWPTLLARTYQMQFTTNLTTPTWLPVGSPQIGTGQSLSFTNNSTVLPEGYYRLQLIR